jgi:hypothetical protein
MADPRLVPMTERRLWAEEAEWLYGPLPSIAEQRANRAKREAHTNHPTTFKNDGKARK